MIQRRFPWDPYHPSASLPDPGDSKAWDQQWTDILWDAENTPSGASALLNWRWGPPGGFWGACRRRVPDLRDFGIRSVLFAGNGVRILPEFFAHWGFDAIAMDFSRVAVEYASTHPADQEDWDSFFGVNRPVYHSLDVFGIVEEHDEKGTRDNIRLNHIPGGSLRHLIGDIRDLVPNAGFEAIAVLNVFLLYPPHERDILLRRVHDALKPGGVLMLQDAIWPCMPDEASVAFEDALVGAGFVTEYMNMGSWDRSDDATELRAQDPDAWWRELEARSRDAREWAMQERLQGGRLLIALPASM